MHDPSLLAFALREQLVTFESIVALARTGPPWEAAQLSWGLASILDDAQLQALQTALRSRRVEALAIQSELIARGRFEVALGEPPDISFDLFEQALPSLSASDRGTWIALVARKLTALLENPDTTTLKRLHAAKVALRYLPVATQSDALESLDRAFDEEAAAGQYSELELDPTLEVARAHASVGSIDRALSLLAQRERRYASFISNQEIAECARVLACLPTAGRSEEYQRFLRWAKATECGGENEFVAEVQFLTATAGSMARAIDDDLLRVVSQSTMAQALAEMLGWKDLAPAVRDAALERLVTLTETYVTTLREVTDGPIVKDFKRQAPAVRQLCVSVWALGRDVAGRPEALDARLRAAARSWSTWLATQDISGDSGPYVNTVIGWAPQCREELGEAIEHAAKLGRTRRAQFVGYRRWEMLFSRDEALEIAKAALASG